MSSSGYQSSSGSTGSPDLLLNGGVRRSTRSRNEPVTYNLRTLSGIDQDESAVYEPRRSAEGPSSQASGPPSESQSPVPNEVKHEPCRSTSDIRKLLLDRELNGRRPQSRIRAIVGPDLKPWRTWEGASNDVNVLAWSPDGTKFAAGATAQSDAYNRPQNLLLGDLIQNSLTELADHWIPRPDPSTTEDPRLFTTVSALQWVGRRLYTASYDHTVKIWDSEAQPRASCLQTLKHNSQVTLMALSSWMPHLLATGTMEGSFCLWDLRDQEPSYKTLGIQRDPRQKANVSLEPTTLAWGQTASTKHFLIGGMQERAQDPFSMAPRGHLQWWRIDESSVDICKLSPDSQNIFDIKWHPSLPRFVTGSTSSPAMSLPPGSRSVVHIYDYIASDSRFRATSQFPCPALDINEVTLCPVDSAYVTASCTDGSTYVWDNRNPGRYLHKLRHGSSLTPLNHEYPREVTDFGVRVALWGSAIDQFYTGGSDGCLKRWDIRRSPEDALVEDVASVKNGLVSGALSEDESHLLLGDYGGGIHVLSSAPCAFFDKDKFDFKYAPNPPSQDPDGVRLVKESILKDELIVHPIYGAMQGHNYQGPYARWARGLPDNSSLEQVRRGPLLEEYQLRQFYGPSVQDRQGLSDLMKREIQQHFNLAHIRHLRTAPSHRLGVRKRKHNGDGDGDGDDTNPSDRNGRATTPKAAKSHLSDKLKRKLEKDKRKRRKRRQPVITNIEDTVIDLTLDSDDNSRAPTAADPQQNLSARVLVKTLGEDEDDEDYWWPDSGLVDANLPDEE